MSFAVSSRIIGTKIIILETENRLITNRRHFIQPHYIFILANPI